MRYALMLLLLLGGCATPRDTTNDIFYGRKGGDVVSMSIPCNADNCGKLPR